MTLGLIDALIPLGAFAVVLAVWLGDGLRYVYDYAVTERGIEFTMFRFISLRRIPFSNIKDVRRTDVKEFRLAALNLKNRRAQSLRPVLLIKRKTWLSRELLLTPEDPDKFIEEIHARLALVGKASEQ
jgi:hypothetical protein